MNLRGSRSLAAMCMFIFCGTIAHAAPPVTVRVALSDAVPPVNFVKDGEVNGLLKEML
jgi:hypothetical protein